MCRRVRHNVLERSGEGAWARQVLGRAREEGHWRVAFDPVVIICGKFGEWAGFAIHTGYLNLLDKAEAWCSGKVLRYSRTF